MYANTSSAARKYQQISVDTTMHDTEPHRLVMMLLDGAIARLAAAKGHMIRNEMAKKGVAIGKAVDIIQGLRSSLDFDEGGEIASNLDSLYDYMLRQILLAHASNNGDILGEVMKLLNDIREGWRAIKDQVQEVQI